MTKVKNGLAIDSPAKLKTGQTAEAAAGPRLGPGGGSSPDRSLFGGGPGSNLGRLVEKPRDFKKTLRRFVRYLRPYHGQLLAVLVFAVLSTSFAIVSPKITGMAMNELSDGYTARMAIQQVAALQEKLPDQAVPRILAASTPTEKARIYNEVMVVGAGRLNLPEEDLPGPEQISNAQRAIEATDGKINFNYLGSIILVLLVLYLLSSLFTLAMQYLMAAVAQRAVASLRQDLNHKLARLPLRYFDQRTHGEILSRMTNDIDTISTTLQQSLTQLITSAIQIVGYIVMMLITSPTLTLIMLATLPLYIWSTMWIAKKSQKYFAAQQKEMGRLSGHVEEMFAGHKIVKAFGCEEDSIKTFDATNDRLYEAGWKAQFISGIMHPLMNFISNLGYVAICVVGGLWIITNRLRLGDITAFIQYSRSFTMPIVQTATIANILQSTVACAERVFEVLDETEESPDSPEAKIIATPRGDVCLADVDFGYTADTPLIQGMNIHVHPGHTIAIVGPTGAGKTTLVNLLMRFYEIDGGTISIDGVDIREMRRENLRSLFGMVLQDTWLFNGTIRDNIAYGKDGATEEAIVAAAKAAHADHFIRTLPEGYATVLNEEASNISQGQKQLLTIARAVLADPAILILDEATSSVDTRTEVLIQEAMLRLMKNRTSFVIAHRLSTIRDAELILVMNEGRIVEQGNHQELLAQGGFYAELYASQFAGEQ